MRFYIVLFILAFSQTPISAKEQLPIGSELFESSHLIFRNAGKEYKKRYKEILILMLKDDKDSKPLKKQVQLIMDKPHYNRSVKEKEIIENYKVYLINSTKNLKKQSSELRNIISILLKSMNHLGGISSVASNHCNIEFPSQINPTAFNDYNAVNGKVVHDISNEFYTGVDFMKKNITSNFDCSVQENRNTIIKVFYTDMINLKIKTNLLFKSLGL